MKGCRYSSLFYWIFPLAFQYVPANPLCMAPGKMSVVKGAQPRTVMYLPAATEVDFDIWWSGQREITVGRNFEAGEGFLRVEVVTLSTGNTAG